MGSLLFLSICPPPNFSIQTPRIRLLFLSLNIPRYLCAKDENANEACQSKEGEIILLCQNENLVSSLVFYHPKSSLSTAQIKLNVPLAELLKSFKNITDKVRPKG